jgi:putative oxidoreductase
VTLFRVIVAALFTMHGIASIFGVLGGAMGHHGGALPVGQWPGWWAALIQLVGGVLVLLGLGTRPAALLCSGSMAYAYFTVHQEHAPLPIQNGGEPAVMFCWAFIIIALEGYGALALDQAVRPERLLRSWSDFRQRGSRATGSMGACQPPSRAPSSTPSSTARSDR